MPRPERSDDREIARGELNLLADRRMVWKDFSMEGNAFARSEQVFRHQPEMTTNSRNPA